MKRWLLLFILLAGAAQGQGWPADSEFSTPNELLRAARDIRLDLANLGPVRFSGGPNFGPGTPAGFNSGDLNQMANAASYFERACLRVEDPRQTVDAYQRLNRAYRRAWRAQPSGTASIRDIGKLMERLDRFYARLEP